MTAARPAQGAVTAWAEQDNRLRAPRRNPPPLSAIVGYFCGPRGSRQITFVIVSRPHQAQNEGGIIFVA